jgi:hypothetical protein
MDEDTPVKTKSMLCKSNVKQFVKGLKDVRVSNSFMMVLDGVVQNEIRRAVRNLGSKKTLTDSELLRYQK